MGSVKSERGSWRRVAKRVLSGLRAWQVVATIVIGLYLVLGIFGPSLAPFDVQMSDLRNRFCPPLGIDALSTSYGGSDCSASNILGTDEIGRDVFSRLLHGARTSLWVVGLSVVIGTVAGVVVGALVNGWRRRGRLVAYAILGLTIVPFAIFVFGQPHTLYIFGVIDSAGVEGAVDWSAVVALSSFSAVLTFALVAVAYQYDETCRRSWFSEVGVGDASSGFCRLLHREIAALAPWIGLATLANAALVFLQSGSRAYQSSAITWSFEREYLFEHVGMFSPFVPMVLFPIAFVTFGVWWFVRHVRGRIKVPSKVDLSHAQSIDDGVGEISSEEESDNFESRSSENDWNDTLTEYGSSTSRRRWVVVVIAIVAAAVVIRFGVAEVVPTVRELMQDSAGEYRSAATILAQGSREAQDCAQEMSSRLRTLRPYSFEHPEVEASQYCLDLYFQHRNAPSHRLTIDRALRFMSQTLTLGLIAGLVSAVLWSASSVSTRLVKRIVEVCVVLVALIGLTMTFGFTGWHLAILRWFTSVGLVIYGEQLVISRVLLYIVRDFAVALGISYLTIAVAKPTLRFAKTVPTLDVLSNWASFFVPSVLLTSGLLILFHYHFPANLLFYDYSLGVIANASVEHQILSISLIRNWLWTYWLALIGYAAIVFGFFAAAIWGFMLFQSRSGRGWIAGEGD